jgi:hypothetical protein
MWAVVGFVFKRGEDMRAKDITVGGTYRLKVNGRLALVTVLQTLGRSSSFNYRVLTHDTHRHILTTARRLRPLVEQPKPAPVKPTLADYPDPDLIRHPQLKPMACVNAQPNELVKRVRSSDILELDEPHERWMRTRVDRLHVSEPFRTVAQSIRRLITSRYRYLSVPRALRRGLLYAAAKRHAANRQTYRMVMGEHPFPTEEMIGRAILGTQADRDRLLRHVDALQGG